MQEAMIIRYLILICYLLYFGSLGAMTHWVIEPVKIVRDKNEITLSYWLDCGSSFEGVIIRPEKGMRKIGILSKRQNKRCLSIPTKHQFSLNQVMSSQGTPLISFNKLIRKRMKLIPVDHSILSKRNDSHELHLSVSLYCKASIGVVLQAGEDKTLKVGLLAGRRRKDLCHEDMIKARIKGINPSFQSSEPYIVRPHLSYQTFIAPIRKGSAKKDSKGFTKFQFLRRCNEAPVGIIKRHSRYAMVVARYSESICPSQVRSKTWTTYRTALFSPESINKGSKFKEIAVDVVSPVKIKASSKQRLSYQTDLNCNNYQGTIFHELDHDVLVASALAQLQEPCKKPPIRLSLKLSGLDTVDTHWKKLRLKL